MGSESKRPNPELRHQRNLRGWSQKRVAEAIDTSKEMVSKWERGEQVPSKYYQEKFCLLFGKSAYELGFIREPDRLASSSPNNSDQKLRENNDLQGTLTQAITKGIIGAIQELGSQDLNELRRKILEITLGITVGQTSIEQIPGSGAQILSTPSITAEEFLPQCAAGIKACWYFLRGKGLVIAEEMLSAYIPSLTKLAFSPSTHQETAAGLATQAKILQAILSMHKLNFVAREMHCHEAVQCSCLSADGGLQAAALMYLAYTYIYCSPLKPEKAIPTFLAALHALGSEASLLRSDIYMGLADAYAQCKEKHKALEAIDLAHTHFPKYPEQDARFLYADCGWFELQSDTGKMYLDLAQYYPDQGYSQKAYELFTQLSGLQSAAERNTNETVIRQADAARGLGDLDLYTDCLEKGAVMALSLGSQKRYSEAYNVFQRTPKQWLHEQKIKALANNLFRQLPGKGTES